MDNAMKTVRVLIVTLIVVVAQGRTTRVEEFYKNLQAQSSGGAHADLAEYPENFRRMYSAFPSIELLKGVVDGMEDFAYGTGSATITCGDAGEGRWISCLDALDVELRAIREKAAEITADKVRRQLSAYRSKVLQLLADYREYEKIATEPEKTKFSAAVGGHPTEIVRIPDTHNFACGIEFVYNGNQDIRTPYRVFDFLADGSGKKSMSAERLYDMLRSIGDDADSASQQIQPSAGLTRQALEERMTSHAAGISDLRNAIAEYAKHCDPTSRWLNPYQLKWKFIKDWEDYEHEWFPGFRLSTYQAKIAHQKISMNDVFDSLRPDPTLDEVMAVNQLVPYVLDGFVDEFALYAHKTSAHLMRLYKTRLQSSTGLSNVRLPEYDVAPLSSFHNSVLNIVEINLNLYSECGLNPGKNIERVQNLRKTLTAYFGLKDEKSMTELIDELKVNMRNFYGTTEQDLTDLDKWGTTYEEAVKTFDWATTKFMGLVEKLNNYCHLNSKRNVEKK